MSWRYQQGLTGAVTKETLYYYLGGKLVALKQGSTLSYVAQDHLTGTSLTTDASGNKVDEIKYLPYGGTRSGDIASTEKKFTGQRLDGTGLYYYGARYYDPGLGRFVSADTMVPRPANPQSLNRYAYALNNPLKYVDPSGHDIDVPIGNVQVHVSSSMLLVPGFANMFPDLSKALGAPPVPPPPCPTPPPPPVNPLDLMMGTAPGFSIGQAVEAIKQTVVVDVIGIEGVYHVDTTLVKDMRVIDVKQGSIIDFILPNTITLYPIGVFANEEMSGTLEEEEGRHLIQQKGPYFLAHDASYIGQYGYHFFTNGLNVNVAHDKVSYERDAMDWARNVQLNAGPW